MSLPATLLKVRLADPLKAQEVGRIQDNVGTLLNEVAAVPILQANTVLGVDLTDAATLPIAFVAQVSHGLGRPWVGWAVTDVDAAEIVYRIPNTTPVKILTLGASGPCTVNVLVW